MDEKNLIYIINNSYFKKDKEKLNYEKEVAILKYENNNIFIDCNNQKYQFNEFIKNKNIKKIDNIVFQLDFSEELKFDNAKKIIKNIIKIGRKIKKYKIKIGIEMNGNNILGNLKLSDSEYENDVVSAIGVLVCKNKKQKYEFLYDQICDYLDKKVVNKNVCGFKNDKCIAKRNTNCTMGCCHHFKNKYFGILYEKELHLCEYQKDKSCTAKCITCKMYMCDYLVKRGYKFTCNNVLLIKYYFNFAQKVVIKSSFFTTKDKILKRINLLSIK